MGMEGRAFGGRITDYIADCKGPSIIVSMRNVMYNQMCLELTSASLR
jgi:hypothetical protein